MDAERNPHIESWARANVSKRTPGLDDAKSRPRWVKIDQLASKVIALVAKGRSYRLIGREVGLSKNTVADIVKRGRINAMHTNAPIG
jgi:DNA-binding CsgD family transcriptional regulator